MNYSKVEKTKELVKRGKKKKNITSHEQTMLF